MTTIPSQPILELRRGDDFVKDMEAVRFNEKVKRLSTLFGAGGVAAILTSFARWADQRFDGFIGTSLFTGIIAILVSIAINDLLVSEDEK